MFLGYKERLLKPASTNFTQIAFMRMSIILFFFFAFFSSTIIAQKSVGVQVLTTGTNTSLRGMSIPSDQVIWVSGSNGTIGRSVDAGATWKWMVVPGFEKKDFRDIDAFDSSTAIAMAVDNPAYIVKTIDGGLTWKKVFERAMEGMFLDPMDFKNEKEGICIGDPLNLGGVNRRLFYIIRTFDGGETWKEAPMYQMPPAQTGEAIFSASGTNISFLDNPDFEFAFVTGGTVSNLYMIGRPGKKSKVVATPLLQGKETAGTFSMATDKQKTIYCIGGDYKVPKDYFDNYFYTTDAGNKWGSPSVGPPLGYRSCVRIIKDKTLVACGPTGVDYAENGQKEWKKASLESFNVCMVSKGKQVFLAGEKGKIGKIVYQ
ncbi:WD40/YVTN/BNR-like repeat-containing protein [Segetibacter aerophilus]|uniref:Oxidoreductase n=1 Tax=Segetibacter aerophilus TaxID=670293 RepID=A0A512B6S7_9BACT|nr:oxidoreductase [Segetibacter aerophilus]GEO07665.1 oxidoreductase [Segetibacter aerophilus]